MTLHLLTRMDIPLGPTTGADKSAMGAVNRPLHRSLAYTHECKGVDDNCPILTRTRTLSGDVASRLRTSSRKEENRKNSAQNARYLRGDPPVDRHLARDGTKSTLV